MVEVAMKNTVIISGIGRSGTGYVAEVLRRCGLRTSHEGVFKGGSPAAPPTRATLDHLGVDVEVSGFAMPHLCEPDFRDLPVVLCVRHPLDWLASWHSKRYSAAYLREHLGISEQLTGSETSDDEYLGIWAHWNLAVAERAVFFFQVEHLQQVDVEAIAMLGGARRKLNLTTIASSIFRVSRRVNSVPGDRKRFYWWSSDSPPILQLGRSFGFGEWSFPAGPGARLAYQLARKFGYH